MLRSPASTTTARRARLLPPLLLFGWALASMPYAAHAAAQIDMSADRWQANGKLSFTSSAEYPHGVLAVKDGGAILKDTTFADGTIEYDINEDADNQGIAGIWLRQRDEQSAENVYLRTESDCPRSIECLQYAPVSHGNVQWDVYPEYQAAAPVRKTGWNHVKLVVAGRRMAIFVNGQRQPALTVGRLAGDASSGAIQLRGDAQFANLTIQPGASAGLNGTALEAPDDADPRFLRHWLVSPASSLARGEETTFSAMPPVSPAWQPIAAEAKGFVNLGRHHGTASGVPDLVWLSTTLDADSAQVKHVSLGWAREVWVYVNGKQVFADRNLYYPASGRKAPLGRMALENGGFDLPLQAGANQIVLAISNDLGSQRHWGWGFQFRLDELNGVKIPPADPGM